MSPLRERLLHTSETATAEPARIATPEPVSRAREHQLRRAESSVHGSSGSRSYAHDVATGHGAQASVAEAQASGDESLADARSRQPNTRFQRVRRAQMKVQSDF